MPNNIYIFILNNFAYFYLLALQILNTLKYINYTNN